MRLFELQPSTVKDLSKLADAGTNKNELIKFLLDRGYSKTSEGVFGEVYDKQGDDFVIKISKHMDPFYLRFAEYAKKNKDPHLPKLKIKSYIPQGEVVPYGFIAFIEKLQPITRDKHEDWLLSQALSVFSAIANKKITLDKQISILKANDFYDEIVAAVRENKSLFLSMNKFKRAMKNTPGNFQYDLKIENLMKRKDGTIVIIDPLSYA